MALYPYPVEFPTREVLDLVIKALKGSPELKESAHAVWVLLGFGLSQWDTHVRSSQPALSVPEVITLLESARDASDSQGAVKVFPWTLLLPILIELLKKILK